MAGVADTIDTMATTAPMVFPVDTLPIEAILETREAGGVGVVVDTMDTMGTVATTALMALMETGVWEVPAVAAGVLPGPGVVVQNPDGGGSDGSGVAGPEKVSAQLPQVGVHSST